MNLAKFFIKLAWQYHEEFVEYRGRNDAEMALYARTKRNTFLFVAKTCREEGK